MAPSTSSILQGSLGPLNYDAVSGDEFVTTALPTYWDELNQAMSDLFVGPMPVDQFLEDFLPNSSQETPIVTKDHFKSVPIDGHEDFMYRHFVRNLSPLLRRGSL
ncbi:hypothetical protein DXG03_005346 [Asterophora parasitica]|uniref:Uncharacterized protein n=1 Tax=Asterophora parasitica TaxID=117018 RepID=A0A9P7G0G0_9AGAR|nr:hypothetical protein DXG03_005346 [Asterophora parasitica]